MPPRADSSSASFLTLGLKNGTRAT
jgi:hypothetical protein